MSQGSTKQIPKHKTIHFIGIGGCGMSAIARILLMKGYRVTGSDLKESIETIRLKDIGADVFLGHKPENLRLADVVVVSTAIPKSNPELRYAEQEKMAILRRAEMLDILMQDFERSISVTGTHGKTTTSSMIACMLTEAKRNPTFLVGADLTNFGYHADLGEGPYFVAESDESDGSFLCLHPKIGIITNMDEEHLDFYASMDAIISHFQRFVDDICQRKGYVILNQDNVHCRNLKAKVPQDQCISFGLDASADVCANDISHAHDGTRFKVRIYGEEKGDVLLKLHGQHNVYNALATIALAVKESVSLDDVKRALFAFSGAKRRFQLIGEEQGIYIYDDYGHHPTEIRTTLEGAKSGFGRRLICVFQPHRYSRTRDLLERFPDAFNAADLVVITEVYSANEDKISGVSGHLILDKMADRQREKAVFIEKKGDIANYLMSKLERGDMVLTMGAGDIHTVAKELHAQLKTQKQVS